MTGTHVARTIVESLSGVRSDARLVHTAVLNMEGNRIISLRDNKHIKYIFRENIYKLLY